MLMLNCFIILSNLGPSVSYKLILYTICFKIIMNYDLMYPKTNKWDLLLNLN